MQAFTIEHKGRVFQGHIPESFNELQRDQLLELCRYFNGRTPLAKAKFKLAYHLLGFKRFAFKRNKAILQIPYEQVYSITTALNWAFAPSTLTRQLLPRVRVGLQTFYGPADFFGNGVFDEVITAFVKLNNYKESNSPGEQRRLLCELMAALYRPRRWWWPITQLVPSLNTGDCREPFNENSIRQRARLFAKLPDEYLYATLLFFEGCQAHWKAIAPDVFSGQKAEQPSDRLGWEKFYVAMAGPKFGDIQKVGQVYFTNILIHLQAEMENKPRKK